MQLGILGHRTKMQSGSQGRAAEVRFFVFERLGSKKKAKTLTAILFSIDSRAVFNEAFGDCFDKAVILGSFCRRHGLDPATVLYVGDTKGDVDAAKRAGVVSVGVTSGYHDAQTVTDAHPGFIFDSAASFIRLYMMRVHK
jgi:phosphoglycolate phosphatase-like HAD superfamily hydrolase